MSGEGKDRAPPEQTAEPGDVIRFPYSRVSPTRSDSPSEAPVYGELARALGLPREQTTGRWCSRCQKIWFGYLLEVACPRCGNRHG